MVNRGKRDETSGGAGGGEGVTGGAMEKNYYGQTRWWRYETKQRGVRGGGGEKRRRAISGGTQRDDRALNHRRS